MYHIINFMNTVNKQLIKPIQEQKPLSKGKSELQKVNNIFYYKPIN